MFRKYPIISIVLVIVAAFLCIVIWKSFSRKTPDPLAPVLVSTQADYVEANKEALLLAGPALQTFGNGQSLTAKDKEDIGHAIQLYRGILAFKPSDPAPYFTLGMCYQAMGMDQKAIDAFNSYLIAGKDYRGNAIRQSRIDTYWLLSKSYFQLKAYGESAKQATQAINLSPKVGRYYTQRASALIQEKNYVQAKKDVEKALQLDPTDEHAAGLLELLNSGGSGMKSSSSQTKP